MKSKILLPLLFAIATIHAQVADKITIIDTRSVNDPPTAFSMETRFHFKLSSIVGLPNSATYSGVMTVAPWGDNSGNKHHQIGFNEAGLYWRTGSPQSSSWDAWSRVLTENASGRVSIGATTPESALHISATARYNLRLYADGNTTNYLSLWQGSNGAGIDPINTGLLYLGYDQSTKVIIGNAGGSLGIGTSSPKSALHVSGSQGIDWQEVENTKGSGLVTIGNSSQNGSLFVNTPTHDSYYPSGLGIDGSYDATNRVSQINVKAFGVKYSSWSSSLAFHTSNGTALTEAMRIDKLGNVGIGTTNPSQKLEVKGTIYSQEVKVDISAGNGPDYVFEPDYKLLSLEEIKSYIEKNKHLPEVPSAKEMETNGVNVSEMNMLLLKKIEELTLYVIELKKENVEIKKENARQNHLIESLKNN